MTNMDSWNNEATNLSQHQTKYGIPGLVHNWDSAISCCHQSSIQNIFQRGISQLKLIHSPIWTKNGNESWQNNCQIVHCDTLVRGFQTSPDLYRTLDSAPDPSMYFLSVIGPLCLTWTPLDLTYHIHTYTLLIHIHCVYGQKTTNNNTNTI